MAKINASGIKTDSSSRKRPGVQAKTKTSKHKRSKLYKKLYKGQGK